MKATARTARRIVKARSTATRTTRRAVKAVATGTAQPVRTHLVAAGMDDATAKRYAGAFSRGVVADGTRTTRIKLKGRARKAVQVKLYTLTTFTTRLSAYRPKDKAAAQLFARLALAA
jgi:hypothetical protein